MRQHLPFSWLRFVVGIISLALVREYPIWREFIPEEMLTFGTAWNYSVFASTQSDADIGKTARVWSYKFDSTSIVWRVFGEFLAVPNFPQCLFYTSHCLNKIFGGDVAFKRLDLMVNSVAHVGNGRQTSVEPVSLILRSENEFIDRFYQFLLLKWFTSINWRIANNIPTPRNCGLISTGQQLPVMLRGKVSDCCTNTQWNGLNVLNSGFNFLESQEDLQISRGGLSSVGYRRSDVSTITRARDCHGGVCETLYVSDYRYEVGFLVADVLEWYHLEWYQMTATLRIVGQSYFILRGIGLLLSCYYVCSVPKPFSKWIHIKKAWFLFMRVPKQCVVYVLAHSLDASFMYEVFKSPQDGILSIEFRTVWIYGLIWQIVVTVATSRWSTRSNEMSNGVVGVPSFLKCIVNIGCTIPLDIISVVENLANFQVREREFIIWWGANRSLVPGLLRVDFYDCVDDSEFLYFWNWNSKQKTVKLQHSHWSFLTPTPVSYSAGVLWPTASVCVYWLRSFFCIRTVEQKWDIAHSKKLQWAQFNGSVVPFASSFRSSIDHPGRTSGNPLRFIQHQMQCVHRRSDDVEATVVFMNIVLLSDPLVYLQIVIGTSPSTQLAYYQSRWRQQLLENTTNTPMDSNYFEKLTHHTSLGRNWFNADDFAKYPTYIVKNGEV
ncbi:hypothetical protein P3T76_004277 [Phytophthora citrophthora]|uniref:Uncharacterized protein n=1 Tax=Phytophthora citrophthora TaxID=4793 RepID=A0AAD9GT59_9STRA|nr:hypothetical protein P3T76_004277 [Phytophthora citrophthora]